MNKTAVTRFPIDGILASRWSPRVFSTRPVELSAIGSLMEAARWAPSCFNEQPWAFIVARREEAEEFAKMLDCLVESNQRWARHAAVLMISIGRLTFERN